jgi:hypothetical protein
VDAEELMVRNRREFREVTICVVAAGADQRNTSDEGMSNSVECLRRKKEMSKSWTSYDRMTVDPIEDEVTVLLLLPMEGAAQMDQYRTEAEVSSCPMTAIPCSDRYDQKRYLLRRRRQPALVWSLVLRAGCARKVNTRIGRRRWMWT